MVEVVCNPLFISSFTSFLLGVYFGLIRSNFNLSICLIFLGGLLIRILVGGYDEQLHVWDEQFHAMVAKNMTQNPFKPMLFVADYMPQPIARWDKTHIWLHKQPLFLWQMAISIKIFGPTAFAARLPSILMSSIVILLAYRISSIIANRKLGIITAILIASAHFSFELPTGLIHTDHNDVAFYFYVCASIWAWFEYQSINQLEVKKKWIYALLIGVFSGMAVLNKWLTGLLVFLGWGITLIAHKEKRFELKHYSNLILAFMLSLLVFLPWQIYIHSRFPLEANFEREYNSKHVFEVVEGHAGGFWFHFDAMKEIFSIHQLLVVFSILVFLGFSKIAKTYKVFIISCILGIYILFTVAVTKMVSFTYCVSPIIYIALAFVLHQILFIIPIKKWTSKKLLIKTISSISISTILFFNINPEKIFYRHLHYLPHTDYWQTCRLRNTKYFESIKDVNAHQKHVLFKVGEFEDITAMYFGDFISAYEADPTKDLIDQIISDGYGVAVLDNCGLPEWMYKDDRLLKISGYWWY